MTSGTLPQLQPTSALAARKDRIALLLFCFLAAYSVVYLFVLAHKFQV